MLYGRCQAFLPHDFVLHFTKHSKNLWNDCNLHEQIDAYIYCLLHRYSRNVESELLKMTISQKNTLDVCILLTYFYFFHENDEHIARECFFHDNYIK